MGDARATAEQRLHIYRHMYLDRLVEVLEAEFPRLARVVGAPLFARLAAAYAADHPSTDPSLRFFGRRFPDWLRAQDHEVVAMRGLGDLAQLEWARADVFDAIDEPLLSIDHLRTVTPDVFVTLPLRCIAASRIISLDGAVPALWEALGPDGDDRSGEHLETTLPPASLPREVLVWRQGTVVYHRMLDAREARVLHQLAVGTTFGLVCESVLAALSPEEATAQAFAWLGTWTADELLVSGGR